MELHMSKCEQQVRDCGLIRFRQDDTRRENTCLFFFVVVFFYATAWITQVFRGIFMFPTKIKKNA